MSNFKFFCPLCGQKILGNANYTGTQISCPTCVRTITVPAPEAAANPAGPYSGASTIPLPKLGAARPVLKQQSRLPVAALVCSIFLPPIGIICGHLALARIRKNPILQGAGIARAALIIGYLLLAVYVVGALLKKVF